MAAIPKSMRPVICAILGVIMWGFAATGCNESGDKQVNQLNTIPVKDTTARQISNTKKSTGGTNGKAGPIAPLVPAGFNLNEFMRLTDSLLTRIIGRPIYVTFKMDTIKAGGKQSLFGGYLYPSDSTIILSYSFYPHNANRELSVIYLIDATYPDSTKANKVFAALHGQSGPVDWSINDHMPGLTYTNDYVMKTNKKIYWLNTGCLYGFDNHLKLMNFMLKTIKSETITDSIFCQCGQPRCKK